MNYFFIKLIVDSRFKKYYYTFSFLKKLRRNLIYHQIIFNQFHRKMQLNLLHLHSFNCQIKTRANQWYMICHQNFISTYRFDHLCM